MTATPEWGARAVPRLRIEVVAAYQETAARLSGLVGRAQRVGQAQEVRASVTYNLDSADLLQDADLMWVTRDMAQLVMDAATDIPDFTPASLPSDNVLVLFGSALPQLATPPLHLQGGVEWRGSIPVWGVWWHPATADSTRLTIDIITRRSDLPGSMMGKSELQPCFALTVDARQGVAFEDVDQVTFQDTGEPMSKEVLGVLSMLSALSHLSDMPTLARREALDARTGKAPRPGRTRSGDLVTMVDLRPMREEHVTLDPASGRVYNSRWRVRGHWARQPYGPGQSLRKTIYREPYIKGPAGAPLLVSDTVMVWRR